MDTLESMNRMAATRRAKAREQFNKKYHHLKDSGFSAAQADVMARWSQERINNVIKSAAGKPDGQT